MLAMDDERWPQLKSGYRLPLDIRPLLIELKSGENEDDVWKRLWDELHHQGDVDQASYAAVPHLVQIYRHHKIPDWNVYSLVTTIELQRAKNNNPEIAEYLRVDYFQSLHELASVGASEVIGTTDALVVRSILGLIAVVHGLCVYGEFLSAYSEEELLDMRKRTNESET